MEPLIAIVDDDLRNAFALSTVVELVGFRDAWFDGGDDFMARYKPEHGCVLLDMLMPGTDGPQVLRRMKTLGWSVPVIAYCLDPRSEAAARQLGAAGFLLKPIPPEELLDLIRLLVETPEADEPFICPAG